MPTPEHQLVAPSLVNYNPQNSIQQKQKPNVIKPYLFFSTKQCPGYKGGTPPQQTCVKQCSSYNSGTHLANLSQWIPPKNYTNTKQVTLVASSLLIHFQRITLVAPSTKQCSSSISSTNKCYKTPFSFQCQTVFSLQ